MSLSRSIHEKWQETWSWQSLAPFFFPRFTSTTSTLSASSPHLLNSSISFFQHAFNMAINSSLTSTTTPSSTNIMSIKKKTKVLSDLPDDLLVHILNSLSSLNDLHSLCLVSKRLHHVADPVLYKSIKFNQPHHHIAFSQSLAHRPRRGSLIQNVRLEYPGSELAEIISLRDGSYRIDNFSDTISRMSNLEVLDISVPEELLHGIGTLFNGPFDLACLKTCEFLRRYDWMRLFLSQPPLLASTFHLQYTMTNKCGTGSLFYQTENNNYWDLQENIHIFSHPTLESLTIRRARLDTHGFSGVEQPSETSLTTLHLIDCDINSDALSELLLFPDALKHITINMSETPKPELEESSDETEDYILALRSADHSLETISLDFPSLTSEKPLRLRPFEQLKSLEIRHSQLFGQTRLNSVGFPPFLERLKFLDQVGEDEDLLELLCYTMEQKDIVMRKLTEMSVKRGKGEEYVNGVHAKLLDACKGAEGLKLTSFE